MRGAIWCAMALVALLVPWGPHASAPQGEAWDEAAADLAVAAKLAEEAEQADAQMAGAVGAEEALPTFSVAGEQLVQRMGAGFLKRIRSESVRWWGCGEMTPEPEQAARADRIARHVLDRMREHDLRWLSHWATIAVIWRESRGDPCAIGPNSRKAARELGIVPADRIFNRWTAEDVRTLVEDPRWRKSRATIGADLGLGQQVWQRYARILDPAGDKACGKGVRCRVPTLDEILSYDAGAATVIAGMVYRRYLYRTTEPWLHWPGNVRSVGYGMEVARIAQAMGGDVAEKPVW